MFGVYCLSYGASDLDELKLRSLFVDMLYIVNKKCLYIGQEDSTIDNRTRAEIDYISDAGIAVFCDGLAVLDNLGQVPDLAIDYAMTGILTRPFKRWQRCAREDILDYIGILKAYNHDLKIIDGEEFTIIPTDGGAIVS